MKLYKVIDTSNKEHYININRIEILQEYEIKNVKEISDSKYTTITMSSKSEIHVRKSSKELTSEFGITLEGV